ncbi:NADPH-dependent FMN reductase [Umezawaea endophytica]|uniref:NAD(P)H-dependent oxidoreductase n=1 Tax=Umezawaea endophytica TaxID=1654476 RepID=A0A9X2VLZ1_9PSEU|nr:NAD(P)H-dependent oxidoreductase [Umezawaea endophytica]MCS7478447.1 NAD(P)H-dependent oxidoreductase [Umezawaea endophytica]
MPEPVLQIVIGSTRPGRAGGPVAAWFAGEARAHGGFTVEVVDLAEVALPMFDEPNHPMTGKYVHDHTEAWSEVVRRASAYVFVTPEYNNGYPAPLKNAIDYLNAEWRDKPVGFVSYGGVSAGTRAVAQLKQVVTTLRMVPVQDAVNIPFIQQFVADGVLTPNDVMTSASKVMLDELVKLSTALSAIRD